MSYNIVDQNGDIQHTTINDKTEAESALSDLLSDLLSLCRTISFQLGGANGEMPKDIKAIKYNYRNALETLKKELAKMAGYK